MPYGNLQPKRYLLTENCRKDETLNVYIYTYRVQGNKITHFVSNSCFKIYLNGRKHLLFLSLKGDQDLLNCIWLFLKCYHDIL